ncbi:MAG: 23S rRNA (adenine(2503)-C(2))-methyltransferase RlmN [Flavobacteriaceae bacterium]|nr:MAG: 23S rRNA (adenine(2503)-C(2))-methyltransferase RlmN [Flavobacteriaceae bacterium]
MRKDIRLLSLSQLESHFETLGEKKFRAKQVYQWLWQKNAHGFSEMSNLSLSLREKLEEAFHISPLNVDFYQRSEDGTIKNILNLFDGNKIESVLIPTPKRNTGCISSQVGCSLDCLFCATAKLKRMRNLSTGEIVDQVVSLDKQSRQFTGKPLTNIVLMGMGEPLLNYPNVVEAIEKITSPSGLGLSPRRITLSTSGIPKMIEKLADQNLRIKLAFSLHSAIEVTRNKIMPFSVKFPLEEIKEALLYWYQKTGSIITLEYVVWKGINDTEKDIDALVDFCKIIPSKVNLIQYNSIGDPDFIPAEEEKIQNYVKKLERNNLTVSIRRSRGQDIDAACGQLSGKTQKE